MSRDALRPTAPAPAPAPAPAALPGPGKGPAGDLDVVRRFRGARSSPCGEAGDRGGGGGDAGDREAAEGTCSGARPDSQDADDDAERYADWEITACMTRTVTSPRYCWRVLS